jgi:hypothetical protein
MPNALMPATPTTPIALAPRPGMGATAIVPGNQNTPSLPVLAGSFGAKASQTVLSKAIGCSNPSLTPLAGRYQRIVVIDNTEEPGISFNPSDKVPDLSHLETVRTIINAGVNGSRQPGQPGYVPIESIALNDFAQNKSAVAPIRAALRQVLQAAPRDAQGRPDLRGVAINLSQTVYGGPPLTKQEAAVFQDALAAGADLFVAESNISHHAPNHIGAIADAPGAGRLFFVGGSDSKMFRNPDSSVPSKQNPWTTFTVPGKVNTVVNSGILIQAIDENGDGKTDGYDINGDGLGDVSAAQIKDTKALEAPYAQRLLAELQVGLDELQDLEDRMVTEYARRVAQDPSLNKQDYATGQRLQKLAGQIREQYATQLKGKLISVDDAIAFNIGPKNETVPTMALGNLFRLDQHVPRGPSLDPRHLYVSVDALLTGPRELRYRDDLVFFTASAAGRVARVGDAPGLVGHSVSANSFAAPYALIERFHQVR